ncbi:MAG: glycosyltransferase family 2 protein, partial [Chitinophagales bacterium]|nr:glycosyltransferase family 2 protein [Chitinophagales bacterium]
MQIKKLSVLVPAYNEEHTVETILQTLLEVKLIHDIALEVVIVNDCSKDRTAEKINQFITTHPHSDIRVIHHEINKGKGAAVHTAIKHASGEYVIVQDADLEYDPHEFNILLRPVIERDADVVFGSRFMGGNPHRILFF